MYVHLFGTELDNAFRKQSLLRFWFCFLFATSTSSLLTQVRTTLLASTFAVQEVWLK